ncbi:MAG TPA: hypothetical protein DCZ62_03720 [Ruminococcus sp.]|nr:hypothetical protein [Ruminococcus sp.]HOO06898.1 hypothetical protein [Ruminococcus sp.]
MKDVLRKTAALALVGAMAFGTAACGDKSSSSDSGHSEGNMAAANVSGDVAEEDLPYGATMTQLLPSINEDVPITIELDERFIDQEAGIAVSNYLSALTNADAALMEKAFYPPYLKASYEAGGFSSAQEYLDEVQANLFSVIAEHAQKDVDQITVDYIIVDNCYSEGDAEAGSHFSDMDQILSDSLGSDFLSKVEEGSRRELYVDFTYVLPNDDTSYDYNYGTGYPLRMYLYKIDGQYYVV